MITRRGLMKLFGAGFLSLIATAAYPFTEVFRRPEIRRYALTPKNWPAGLKLRVAVLADFHASEPWMSRSRIEDICAMANALEPDICLLLGDYAAGTNIVSDYVDAMEWAAALATLRAPLGIHAVLGNHDYWEDLAFQRDPSVDNIATKALQQVGIATYVNGALRLEKDGQAFWIAGLGDQMALRPGKNFNRKTMTGIDDLAATMRHVTDNAPIILMAHEPDIFPEVTDRVTLTLSCHTHGGQVNLFGWRPVAASRGSWRYPGGHFHENDRHLIVSRGLGCSFLPVRVGVRPEILLLELGSA